MLYNEALLVPIYPSDFLLCLSYFFGENFVLCKLTLLASSRNIRVFKFALYISWAYLVNEREKFRRRLFTLKGPRVQNSDSKIRQRSTRGEVSSSRVKLVLGDMKNFYCNLSPMATQTCVAAYPWHVTLKF